MQGLHYWCTCRYCRLLPEEQGLHTKASVFTEASLVLQAKL